MQARAARDREQAKLHKEIRVHRRSRGEFVFQSIIFLLESRATPASLVAHRAIMMQQPTSLSHAILRLKRDIIALFSMPI